MYPFFEVVLNGRIDRIFDDEAMAMARANELMQSIEEGDLLYILEDNKDVRYIRQRIKQKKGEKDD